MKFAFGLLSILSLAFSSPVVRAQISRSDLSSAMANLLTNPLTNPMAKPTAKPMANLLTNPLTNPMAMLPALLLAWPLFAGCTGEPEFDP